MDGLDFEQPTKIHEWLVLDGAELCDCLFEVTEGSANVEESRGLGSVSSGRADHN